MPSLFDQIIDTLAQLRAARRHAHPDRPRSLTRVEALEDNLNRLLDRVPRTVEAPAHPTRGGWR
ncbi:hypothetical protein [Rhodococcus sp. 2G]|uniref:hypothetical protein n=1 Tax=Rhodococcus sp. 2G TaxID=1570939 RepID=UPI0012EB8F32|nr:hypothetical protein [Rhodococcus sp. 2G]